MDHMTSARDQSIRHMPFLIGDPLEPSLYLQPLSRYSAQHMLTNEHTHTNKHDESQYLLAKVIKMNIPI